MAYSATDKVKAMERELGFRRRVYARRVAEGKMSQEQSDREIGIFEAIRDDYQKQVESERLI